MPIESIHHFFRILVLLWSINLAPVLVGHLLREKWDRPIDGGWLLSDGHPLFGPHKTIRGALAGVATGTALSLPLGFPLQVGFACGVLAMAGDLLSSYIKRRRRKPSGHVSRGLDQGPEGALPLLVLVPYCGLDPLTVLLLLATFGLGAYYGSVFLYAVLRREPVTPYPRPLDPATRLKEFRRCQVTDGFLHHVVNIEDSFYYHVFMEGVFRVLGIFGRGKRNALRLVRREVDIPFPGLPEAFDGYRILLLSDLHLDGLEGLAERLIEVLKGETADLCVFAGDLRMETHGPWEKCLELLSRVMPHIDVKDGIFAVLGNHDCIEMVEPLRGLGIQYLINDAVPLRREGGEFWLVGADDPHYYRCHDLDAAFAEIPPGAFSVFVAHSNEIYREAAENGARLYLCGHSHAGQIRLPLVGALFTHSSAPRRMVAGLWSHGRMKGYSTAGVGVSGIPVRFGSKGEVTVVRLRCGA